MSKELWEFLIGNAITITVEYLPGKLNTLTDKESRKKNSSEWKLNPRIFRKPCYGRDRPEIDLFANHLSQGTNAFQQSWKNLKTYAFPPFSLVGRVLKKIPERASKPFFNCATMAVTSMVSMPVADVLKSPILLPKWPNLLKIQLGKITH